jgi:hypothetical protein
MQTPHESAADHAAMAGNKDLIRLLHDSCADRSRRKYQEHKHREEQQVNAALQDVGFSAGKRNDTYS